MARGGSRRSRTSIRLHQQILSEQSQRSELAKTYTEEALETLVDVARNGRTDAARSLGQCPTRPSLRKPTASEERSTVDLPPMVIELTRLEVTQHRLPTKVRLCALH